jgi:hypothetical protein
MLTRDDKMKLVLDIAKQWLEGPPSTLCDLLQELNRRGVKTNLGKPYCTPRGVGKLVAAAYAYAHDELGLGDDGAAPIAEAFTGQDGRYCWDREHGR